MRAKRSPREIWKCHCLRNSVLVSEEILFFENQATSPQDDPHQNLERALLTWQKVEWGMAGVQRRTTDLSKLQNAFVQICSIKTYFSKLQTVDVESQVENFRLSLGRIYICLNGKNVNCVKWQNIFVQIAKS